VIEKKLEGLWSQWGAWPELVQAMRSALWGERERAGASGEGSRWSRLSALCCQAAGGVPERSQAVTLAWLAFYTAAHLMDRVQDGDPPEAWWAGLGAGAALSAASGLYFSASLVLNELYEEPATRPLAGAIAQDFFCTFLTMTSGQYADLTLGDVNLEQYWRIAESKSGGFFALACRAGARLGGADEGMVQAYGRFGCHLGLLVQIKDDLDEVRPPDEGGLAGQRRALGRALPAVYALEVLPAPERQRLKACLRQAPQQAEAAQEALRLLDQCGAGLYVLSEMERHKALALQALAEATPLSPAGDELAALVQNL